MSSSLTAVSEKRRSRRYDVPMAIALEAGERKDRVGVALDVSIEGARFNTASRFSAGDTVTLTLMIPELPSTVKCDARIVRFEEVATESTLLWRYVAAVQFERPQTLIEPTLLRGEPVDLS